MFRASLPRQGADRPGAVIIDPTEQVSFDLVVNHATKARRVKVQLPEAAPRGTRVEVTDGLHATIGKVDLRRIEIKVLERGPRLEDEALLVPDRYVVVLAGDFLVHAGVGKVQGCRARAVSRHAVD